MRYTRLQAVCMLLILSLAASIHSDARTRKVLFIGNSYIYSNDIPGMLKGLVEAGGDTIIYDAHTPGGFSFDDHYNNTQTIAKIQSNQWDVVILQEQSQKPGFSASSFATWVFPYAEILDSIIRKNNSCSETMFYMTWGRKNGDASSCAVYPPMCTYLGMQKGIHDNYLQMTQDLKAVVAPVGVAWKEIRDSLPSIDLYSPDESHPSVAGSYLAACVFYASIYHRNPDGNSYISSLSAADAQRLQYYAGKVVMDSLNQWQQYGDYVYAGFDYSVSNNDVTFTNTSLKGMNYTWDFGDGSNSMQQSPSHTYASKGKYAVKLTVSNGCYSETKVDTVNIGNVSVGNVTMHDDIIKVANSGSSAVTIDIVDSKYTTLHVYSVSGAQLKTYTDKKSILINDLPAGIYVYKLSGKAKTITGRFAVH